MIQVFPTNFPPSNTPIIDEKGAMSIPGMAFFRALFNRTGQDNGLVSQVDTAVGSGNIISDWNLVTGGASNTLPALTGGQLIMIQNATGGGITISAPAGATIDGITTYPLPDTKMQIFWYFSASIINSTQLG